MVSRFASAAILVALLGMLTQTAGAGDVLRLSDDPTVVPVPRDDDVPADPAGNDQPDTGNSPGSTPESEGRNQETPGKRKKAAITVDAEARRVIVAARFTGARGLIETGVCGSVGKPYLSVLRIDSPPAALVRALQSAGFEPGSPPRPGDEDAEATGPTGPAVTLHVEWFEQVGARTVQHRERLEAFLWHKATDAHLPEAPWTFAGSTWLGDNEPPDAGAVLAANLTGTVAAIGHGDPSAVLYYGEPVDPSRAWRATPALTQEQGTPCRLVIEPAEATTDNTPDADTVATETDAEEEQEEEEEEERSAPPDPAGEPRPDRATANQPAPPDKTSTSPNDHDETPPAGDDRSADPGGPIP